MIKWLLTYMGGRGTLVTREVRLQRHISQNPRVIQTIDDKGFRRVLHDNGEVRGKDARSMGRQWRLQAHAEAG